MHCNVERQNLHVQQIYFVKPKNFIFVRQWECNTLGCTTQWEGSTTWTRKPTSTGTPSPSNTSDIRLLENYNSPPD